MNTKPIIKKDLIIVGSGPAGLTAGIYAGRLKLNPLILENEIIGGQIRDAYVLENYPGFASVSGSELIDKMVEQATISGAAIDEFDEIISIDLADNQKIIETATAIYLPTAVIISSGAKRRLLPIPEESLFHSKGIHYCELCDGHMYEGKHLAVVGGGNSALLAVKFLCKYASKITIIQQLDTFQAEQTVQDEIFANEKVEILWQHEVRHAYGEDKIESLQLEDLKTGKAHHFSVDGVFVYIGYVPGTALYGNMLELDRYGSISADETTMTSIAGVFAAGDVRSKQFRQVTTAVADGTVAAMMAEKYINSKKEEVHDNRILNDRLSVV